MNAKTLKKVFAAVLAIAILAVGIPVSFPAVVKADVPAMPKFDVMQNVNIYATYKPSSGHYPGTTVDPTTGLVSTTTNTSGRGVSNFYGAQEGSGAPVYDSVLYARADFVVQDGMAAGGDGNRFGLRYGTDATGTPMGVCIRGNVIFYDMNSNGVPQFGKTANMTIATGDVVTFAYALDPIAKTIQIWVKNNTSGVLEYSGVIDVSSIKGFEMGLCSAQGQVLQNMAAWQPVNDLPNIGDKTNLAANMTGNDFFTVTKNGGKITATSKKNADGNLAGWWEYPGTETNLKEGEVILVSADITVPSTAIAGLIYGQIVESDGRTKRVGVAIRNTDQYYLSLDSYESEAEGVSCVAPGGVSITAGDTFRVIYRYDTRNDTIKVWLNEGGKVVTGEVSVAEAIANNNFAFTAGFIGSTEGQVYDNIAVWKEVEVEDIPVEEPEVYEPGDEIELENGKVVVNEVDTDEGTITVKVEAPEGYQLVAGSLKINGKNIINATNAAGDEFEVAYTAGDEITAEFQPIATTSTSAAVLGTGVRRDENEEVDGVRFVNRMYLPVVADDTFVNVQWDDIYVNYEGVQYLVKDYGMICDRAERITGELTMENAKWTVTAKRGKIFALTDNYIDMTLVITTDNPTAEFYAREYTVRGYIVLEAADGSTVTILTEAFTDSADAAVGRGA